MLASYRMANNLETTSAPVPAPAEKRFSGYTAAVFFLAKARRIAYRGLGYPVWHTATTFPCC